MPATYPPSHDDNDSFSMRKQACTRMMVEHSRLHRRPHHCKFFFCFYYNHESDTQLWNLQDVLWSVNALLSALVHGRNLGLLLSITPGRSEEFVGHKTAEKAALLTGAIAQRCCGAVSPSLIKLYCGEDRPCWTMTFLVPLRKRTGWHSALRGP